MRTYLLFLVVFLAVCSVLAAPQDAQPKVDSVAPAPEAQPAVAPAVPPAVPPVPPVEPPVVQPEVKAAVPPVVQPSEQTVSTTVVPPQTALKPNGSTQDRPDKVPGAMMQAILG